MPPINPVAPGSTAPIGDYGPIENTGNVNNAQNTNLSVGYGNNKFDPNDLNLLFDSSGQVNNQLLGDATFKLQGLQKDSADIFTLMALMVKMGKEQREGARQVMGAERALQQADLKEAADKMREAADMALAAAIVSGVFKIAGGATNMIGGMQGMKSLNAMKDKPDANAPTTTTGTGTTNATKSAEQVAADDNIAIQKVTAQGRVWDGFANIIGSVGDTIGAGLTHQSTYLNADQKESEASATQHEANAEREQQFMQNLSDMITKITGLIQDIQQSNNDSAKRAASV